MSLAPGPLSSAPAESTHERAVPRTWAGAALVAFAVLAVAMRASAPGWLQLACALASLALVAVCAGRVALVPRLALLIVAALALRLALVAPQGASAAARGVGLLRQLAYFALPPLLVHLLVAWRLPHGLAGLRLDARLFYAPAGVACAALAGYEALVARDVEGAGLARAAFGALYALPVLALLWHELRARGQPPAAPPAERAATLEEQGRFGVAERYYAQERRFDKAAEMAERAGEWARAADLHQRAGDDFRAAEMAFRAGQLDMALGLYEKAGAHAAAGRVAEQLGQGQQAARHYERAGDPGAAVAALEACSLKPSGDLLARAGRLADAIVAWQEEGQHARAAEALAQDFQDLESAAQVYFNGGLYLSAAQLFERLGNRPAALTAYLALPDRQVDAARVCLASGDVVRAGELLATLPQAARDALDDEASLLLVAEIEEQTGQLEAALATLQRLRRRADPPPAVFLPLGRCLHARGLSELAEEALRAARESNPSAADALEAAYLLGCVLEERGREAEAAEVFLDVMRSEVGYRDAEDRYRRLAGNAGRRAS